MVDIYKYFISAYAVPWSEVEWGKCDPHTGTQERTRTCKKPKYGGAGCSMALKEIQTCSVDCQCGGVKWSAWSPCSVTCGKGTREKTRVCKAQKNNGRACTDNDSLLEFSTKVTEECIAERRCPIIVEGEWGKYSDWSKCSVKCGGGAKSRSRKCVFPGKTVHEEGVEPYDEDYDRDKPCIGSGIETIGGDGDEEHQCNKESCQVSTLFFLMDTTGSFSGVDQNSALDLGIGLLKELKKDGVEVPQFRIIEINDPETKVKNVIENQKDFEKKLKGIYKESHPSGGDWAEKSMDGILKAVKLGNHGAVVCLFTDAPSKDLKFESDIKKKITEKDIHMFIFLTPDYDNNNAKAFESYKVYQKISNRHTYIMSKTEASTASIIMHKALKSSQKGNHNIEKQK